MLKLFGRTILFGLLADIHQALALVLSRHSNSIEIGIG